MTRDEWPQYICCVLAVRKELIDTDRPTVQRLVNNVLAAGQWLESGSDKRHLAADLAARKEFFNQDSALIRYVMDNPKDRVTYGDLRLAKSEFYARVEAAPDRQSFQLRGASAKYLADRSAP